MGNINKSKLTQLLLNCRQEVADKQKTETTAQGRVWNEAEYRAYTRILKALADCEDTFLDLLQSGQDIHCDLIIGDCDMPATFIWDEDSHITPYGIEQFSPIMEAQYKKLANGNIVILCDDYDLGKKFTLAAAGYIGCTEWDRMFGRDNPDRKDGSDE